MFPSPSSIQSSKVMGERETRSQNKNNWFYSGGFDHEIKKNASWTSNLNLDFGDDLRGVGVRKRIRLQTHLISSLTKSQGEVFRKKMRKKRKILGDERRRWWDIVRRNSSFPTTPSRISQSPSRQQLNPFFSHAAFLPGYGKMEKVRRPSSLDQQDRKRNEALNENQ